MATSCSRTTRCCLRKEVSDHGFNFLKSRLPCWDGFEKTTHVDLYTGPVFSRQRSQAFGFVSSSLAVRVSSQPLAYQILALARGLVLRMCVRWPLASSVSVDALLSSPPHVNRSSTHPAPLAHDGRQGVVDGPKRRLDGRRRREGPGRRHGFPCGGGNRQGQGGGDRGRGVRDRRS